MIRRSVIFKPSRIIFLLGAAIVGSIISNVSVQAHSELSILSEQLAYDRRLERIVTTAIFDEDRRRAIMELRKVDISRRSQIEQAILVASNRTGTIMCSEKPINSNGILIQLADGKDAVITSAHAFVDQDNVPKCDLTDIEYMPNVNMYTGEWNEEVLKVVKSNSELPINLGSPGWFDWRKSTSLINDFLIFVLSENVSSDRLSDGSVRGFISIADRVPISGKAYFIGINSSLFNGETGGYESCNFESSVHQIYHDCAATVGSSSSAILISEEGELVAVGLHSRENSAQAGMTVPSPRSLTEGNTGLSMDVIEWYLSRIGRPAVLFRESF